jgi:hypothetical protein
LKPNQGLVIDGEATYARLTWHPHTDQSRDHDRQESQCFTTVS